MPELVERLKSGMQCDAADRKLLEDALQEIVGLRERRDSLEEILIILARTGLPWDADGNPTDALPAFRERYLRAMHEASELLGLELRSTITRTEPRT
jgi:hypothetical protein